METTPDLERVQELWDRTVGQRIENPIQGWLDSRIVLESYVQPKVAGSSSANWLVGLVGRAGIPKGGRWLSLGCGSADVEVLAGELGLYGSLLAVDASPASLEHGAATAKSRGVDAIRFELGDLNRIELPASSYNVVLMNMSLHHVKELRSLLSRIRRALVPDGYLVVNEFIGPRQFQFTDLQLALVAELLEVLPEFWRRDCTSGEIKSRYLRMPVEHWNVADPSEAIRSDLIVAELERQFEIVERVDYGGTILNLLLEHIVHNFNADDEKDVAAIRLLATSESILIRHGVIPSDFSAMVMRKGRPGVARLRRLLSGGTARGARGSGSQDASSLATIFSAARSQVQRSAISRAAASPRAFASARFS